MQKQQTNQNRLAQLRGMLKADPENLSLWRSCVEAAQELNNGAAIRELAEFRLLQEPLDAEAQFHIATALMAEKNYSAAIEHLYQLHTILPEDAAINQNLGLCHYLLEQHKDAHCYLRTCYETGNRTADVLRLLVSCCHHLGLLEEAVAIATDNPQLAKGDAGLAGVYALLFLDNDDSANATRYANHALRRDSNSIDGLVVSATLRLAQLSTESAIQQFNAVLEIEPHTGRAWIGLGTASLLAQDLKRANQQIRKGLEFMPDHVGSWHVLAWIELMEGNLDDASQIFEHALEMDRNFAESHGGLAAVAALRGDGITAARHIEVADRLDPACLSARYAEAVLKNHAGSPDDARAMLLSTVAGLSPNDGGKISELLKTLTRH